MPWPFELAPFSELALLLLVCALAGALLLRLRQPLLLTYILAGIVLGPAGVGLVTAHSQMEMLAQLGITVLLFVVGLKLDLAHTRNIGPVALATGLGQLFFTIVIGFAITLALGKSWLESVYIAVALTFSSTIIIVKLLSDKRELDSLHGRIAVGFLIVQDLAVVVALMIMSAMRDTGGLDAGGVIVSLALRLGVAALATWVLMRWVLPRLVGAMARSQELLLLFALAWGASLAALGEAFGFSKEAGAFLAGFSLASTPFRDAMSARLAPLRDFLLLFFFIHLGSMLELGLFASELLPAAVLSLFVLVGNPLIVMAIMGFMGYRKRTGLLAGLTVAQISEFSILFVAMGISTGHVDAGALGLTTLVGLVTITVSTYMILHSQAIYERLSRWLDLFERRLPHRELEVEPHAGAGGSFEVVVFGLGRYGSRLFRRLDEAGVRVLGIDFDPEVVRAAERAGLPVRFGDCEDTTFVEELPLVGVRWAVATLPDRASTRGLLHALELAAYRGSVAVARREHQDADERPLRGVTRVIRPFEDAADHAADMLVAELRGGSTAERARGGQGT